MHKYIHPETVTQNTNESITKDGIYDFRVFSKHEIDTIISVLRNAFSDKYPKVLRGVGLMNESYAIVYKPRYILLEMVIRLFENSRSPYDALAVAEAYSGKGAAYRSQALEKYELYIRKATVFQKKTINGCFVSLSNLFLFDKISSLYEQEHNLYRALEYAELAEKLNADQLPHYPIHTATILLKIEPIKAVEYLTGVLQSEKYSVSKPAIENALKEVQLKVNSGYRYKPRVTKIKPDNLDKYIENATAEFLPGGKYYALWAK